MNLFACNLSVSNQFLEWSFFYVFENNSYHFRRTGGVWGFPLFLDFEGKSVIKFLDACQMRHFIVLFVTCVFE